MFAHTRKDKCSLVIMKYKHERICLNKKQPRMCVHVHFTHPGTSITINETRQNAAVLLSPIEWTADIRHSVSYGHLYVGCRKQERIAKFDTSLDAGEKHHMRCSCGI